MTALATIYSYNADASERASLERSALFFAPGTVDIATAKRLQAAEGVSFCRPHKLWPDGTVRSAYIDVWREDWPVGLGTTEVDVDAGTAPDHDGGERANLVITALAQLLASPGGIYVGTTRLNLEGGKREFVEDWATPMRRAIRVYGKDQGYRYEIIAKLWTPLSTATLEELDLRACDLTIRVDWNDRHTTSLEKLVPAVSFKYVTANLDAISWNFEEQRVLSTSAAGGVTTVVLTAEHLWNDAQGLEASARIQFAQYDGADLIGRPIDLLQEDLMLSGGIGTVGRIPRAARDEADRDAMITLWENRIAGLPTVAAASAGDKKYVSWEPGFFQTTYAGQAGDHFGFGLMGPGAIYWNAPNCIHAMRWSHEQERHRPIWFSNDNGTPASFADIHRSHWFTERPASTGDLRGKVGAEVPSSGHDGYTTIAGGVWYGVDSQHAEDYTLTVYPMLTGDEAALLALQDRFDRWAAQYRTDTGNAYIDSYANNTDSVMFHRGVRGFRELIRAYDVLPENAHWRKIIEERIEQFQRVRTQNSEGGKAVVPAQTYSAGPWPTRIPDRVSWSPYGDSLVAEALVMAGVILGSPTALNLAAGIAQNMIRHGWQLRDEGPSQWWQIANCIDYADGADLDEQNLPAHTTENDPTNALGNRVHWADDTGYALWAYGAAAVAWNTLIQIGSVQDDLRAGIIEDLDKCGSILRSIQAGYPGAFQDPSEILEQQPRALTTPISVRENNAEFLGIELLPPPAWSSLRPQEEETDVAPGTSTDVDLLPVSDPGSDRNELEGDLVTLDGSASYDPNGSELAYQWLQIAGTTVSLSEDGSQATFTAPAFTDTSEDILQFKLTVTDGAGKVAEALVTITVVDDLSPTADAGPDANAEEGTLVNLDGTDSEDPEEGALTYAWVQTSGTSVSLTGADTATPSFTAPTYAGDSNDNLVFELTVTDEKSQTDTDTVTITVTDAP